MNHDSKRQTLPTKITRGLCVGYVVVFNSWLALSFAGMSWESFYPRYRLPQVAAGIRFAALTSVLLALALGVALGYRWARWTSIALAASGVCFSVGLFWDGYLRVKPAYSGEESSEVFMALIFSITCLCVLVAMSLPAAKAYYREETAAPFERQ